MGFAGKNSLIVMLRVTRGRKHNGRRNVLFVDLDWSFKILRIFGYNEHMVALVLGRTSLTRLRSPPPMRSLPRKRRRGPKMFEGRGAIGYDHGYDGEVFYLGLPSTPTT
jgi:prepilin-type processing-associated H-X9-DG protein